MRYIVNVNGKQYDVEIEKTGMAAPQPMYAPPVPQPAYAPPAPQATPAPAAPAAPAPASSGGFEVTSPMPGNIHNITVSVGQAVNPGDCLLVIEAMKMENEIVAPQAGTVKQILVNKGTMVDTNDVLVVLN